MCAIAEALCNPFGINPGAVNKLLFHGGQDRARGSQGAMKKTFPLVVPERQPKQVLDAIKHELRKYLKRERRKPVPEGVDFWDFDCRVGKGEAAPEVKHPGDVERAIEDAAKEGCPSVFVEILAKPGHRTKKAGEG